jgi:hypothetical protein
MSIKRVSHVPYFQLGVTMIWKYVIVALPNY